MDIRCGGSIDFLLGKVAPHASGRKFACLDHLACHSMTPYFKILYLGHSPLLVEDKSGCVHISYHISANDVDIDDNMMKHHVCLIFSASWSQGWGWFSDDVNCQGVPGVEAGKMMLS